MRQLSYVIAVVAAGLGFALMTAAGCFPFSYETIVGGGGAGGQGGSPCTVDGCDDTNPCTQDTCEASGCKHVADDTAKPKDDGNECTEETCAGGRETSVIRHGDPCGDNGKLTCDGKVCSGCALDMDCGETNVCKTSICNKPDKTCSYTYVPIGKTVSDPAKGDCMILSCNGVGATIPYPDDTDLPDDQKDCKEGTCTNGNPGEKPSPLGTPCTSVAGYCNTAGACKACTINAGCAVVGETCFAETVCVSCKNSTVDGDETDVDCGGSCGKCADKLKCKVTSDCISGNCSNGKCASCNDGATDGSETDVDCGGSCEPCSDTKICTKNTDCSSMKCEGSTCISCVDGVQNGGEAAVDCGGTSTCLHCPGTTCVSATDCAAGHCESTVCCNAACAGACKSCNLPSKAGLCSDVPVGVADTLCPPATPVCKNGGCIADGGKGHYGDPCINNGDCVSMSCQGTNPAAKCQ